MLSVHSTLHSHHISLPVCGDVRGSGTRRHHGTLCPVDGTEREKLQTKALGK